MIRATFSVNASRRARHVTAVCVASWIVVVWMAAGIAGNTAAPQVTGQTAPQAASPADIEKGKTAVTQICVGCHDGGAIMRMIAVRKKTADEWRDTVFRMIGRGAQVFPDEIEPLTAYLTAAGGQASLLPAGGGRRGRAAEATTTDNGDATAILERRCQLCHDLAKATTKPATAESWDGIIDRMVKLGAAVTPAEHQTLIAYLNAQQK
jgi:cytochrome c2